MKQIKTIRNRIDNSEAFDGDVNAAIAEGWTLTKRSVLRPGVQPVIGESHTMLYAELEREVYGKNDPKSCTHCKHKNTLFIPGSPCPECKNHEKWELSEMFVSGHNAKKEDAET